MKKHIVILIILASSLLGCGGSSGSSDTTTTTTTPATTTTTTTSSTSSVSSTTATDTTTSSTGTVTTTSRTTTTTSILLYTIYPETDQAPTLTFYWGESKETVVPPSVTSISSRYGGWEGSGGGIFKAGCEPASESEMVFSTTREPVYSYSRGTIVEATYEAVNAHGQPEGEVGIRYGRNYLVKHVHLVDFQPGVVVGQTIEAGELLGYTEWMGGGSFWELEMCWIKNSTQVVSRPVVFFLDTASAQVFDDILTAVGQTSWYHTSSEATTESWVPYVGTTEAWADCSKFGVREDRTGGFESPETYYGHFGLSWIFN